MLKQVDCYICNKKNLTKNEVGLNKKLIGQKVHKFHCIKCLASHFEVSVKELEERIEEFKEEGCVLFE